MCIRDRITEVIRAKHNLKDCQLDDFRVWDMAEMSRAMSSTTEVMTNLLMIVAMISLVVEMCIRDSSWPWSRGKVSSRER